MFVMCILFSECNECKGCKVTSNGLNQKPSCFFPLIVGLIKLGFIALNIVFLKRCLNICLNYAIFCFIFAVFCGFFAVNCCLFLPFAVFGGYFAVF